MSLVLRQGTAICLFLFGVIAMFGAEDTAPRETAGTNVLDPALAAQARLLGMLSQVVMQLEHYVRNKDLSDNSRCGGERTIGSGRRHRPEPDRRFQVQPDGVLFTSERPAPSGGLEPAGQFGN